jgi:transketolase
MEGISNEAASLAGHLKLGKLITLYDSNDISLDGELGLSFSESVKSRFEGYGWQYLLVNDGTDLAEIHAAIAAAQAETTKPTLIEVKTVIGFGSPNKAGKGGHAGTHGSPLGKDETVLTKEAYAWPSTEPFHVPAEVRARFAEVQQNGAASFEAWRNLFEAYKAAHPALAEQFEAAISNQLPADWRADLPAYSVEDKAAATRATSGAALNALANRVPTIIGGSADLESSTNTHLKGLAKFDASNYAGRNVYFGVREFAMGAAANGMALHGGVRPYAGTFFVFSDYLKPAIRLSALMKLPVTYVFTHDSIAVGEDGPTHEPIEQLPALRIIPDLTVIRPADGNETSQAWRYAIENTAAPVALVLTRQNLPVLAGSVAGAEEGVNRGAYVVYDAANGQPQAQLLATGSEVQLAVAAAEKLAEEGIQVRVVSMPSLGLFDKQPKAYKDSVILPEVKARLAIEMAYPLGWEKYVGDAGDVLGITTYGHSAPGALVMERYGFNVDNVIAKVKALL